jgi:ketosteroid isomerase-like protein
MKKRGLAFLLLLCSSFCFAQSKDEQAIRSIIKGQEDAWNAGNMDAYLQYYWKDDSFLRITNKRGLKWGWQAAADDYKKLYPDAAAMGKTTLDIISMKRLSSTYYFVVEKSSLVRGNESFSGYSSLLFKKIKRHWYPIVDH